VQREEEDGRVLLEDGLRPIAVVHIPVHDEHPPQPAARRERSPRGDRDRVEEAEARHPVLTGMVAGRAHERKAGGDLAAEDTLGQRDDAARRPPCRTSRLRIVEHVAAERPAATRAAAPRASERRLGVGERLEGVEVLRCVNRLRLRPRRLAWSHPRQPVQQPSLAKRTVDDAHALGRLDVRGPGARWRKVLRMAVVDEADGHEMP